jgi:hypothetical protein
MSQLWQRRIMAVTIVALVILLFLVLARCWFLLRTREGRRWDDPHSPKQQQPRTDLLIHSDSESEFQRMISGSGKRPGRHAGSSAGSSSG